jgi:hypothetical protein
MSLVFYCEMTLEWVSNNAQFIVQETRKVGEHDLRLVFGN